MISDDRLSMMIVSLKAAEAMPQMIEALEELQEFRESQISQSLLHQAKEIKKLQERLSYSDSKLAITERNLRESESELKIERQKLHNVRVAIV